MTAFIILYIKNIILLSAAVDKNSYTDLLFFPRVALNHEYEPRSTA